MHGSIRTSEIKKLGDSITVGLWKEFRHLSVKNATGQYRPTRHAFRFFVLGNTKIIDIDPIDVAEQLHLTSFEAMLNPNFNQNYLVDCIGQVTNVDDMVVIEVGGRPTKKIDIKLRDAGETMIRMTLWESYAEKFWQGCVSAEDGKVICVIQYGKVKHWDGINYLSNAFDATILLINPQIPEVLALKNALPRDDIHLSLDNIKVVPETTLVVKEKEKFEDYPLLNIDQILQSGDVGKCRVISTIFAIDCDYGWYYFNCRTCSTTVEWKENEVDPSKKEAWWCKKCDAWVKLLTPRYRLYVMVKDETSEMKCLLFDTNATKIVAHSAAKILNGSIDPISDPTNLPQALRNIIGSTWQLCVSIEKDNLQETESIYKVLKVWAPHQMIGESSQHSGLSNGIEPVSIIGTEQAPLLITNSDDKSDHDLTETPTPSSKRKEDMGGSAPDELSTTRKMSCTKKIKLEMDDQVITKE